MFRRIIQYLSNKYPSENTRRLHKKRQGLERLGQNVIDAGLSKGLSSYLQKLNPALDIRSAIELANFYKLELRHGITPCVAYLHKDHWTSDLNLSVPAGQYGSFFQDLSIEEKKGTLSIAGFGSTVEEAVCNCLINARTAGVL